MRCLANCVWQPGSRRPQPSRQPAPLQDLSRLRRLAVTHGFVNDRIRAVVWPRLLGITPPPGGGLTLALAMSPSLAPSTPVAAAGSTAAAAVAELAPAVVTDIGGDTGGDGGAGAEEQRQGSEAEAGEDGGAAGLSSGQAAGGGEAAGAAGAEGMAAEACGWQSAAAQSPASPRAASTPLPLQAAELPAPCRTESGALAGGDGGAGESPRGPSSCVGVGEAAAGEADTARRRDSSPAAGTAAGARSEDAVSNGRAHNGVAAGSGSESGAAAAAKAAQAEPGSDSAPAPEPGPSSDAGSGPDAEPQSPPRPVSLPPKEAAAAAAAGGEPEWDWDWERYLQWSQAPHRDAGVVEVDVARSLWSFAADDDREARRAQLKRLLNAVVGAHAGAARCGAVGCKVARVLLAFAPGVGSATPTQLSVASSNRGPPCLPARPPGDVYYYQGLHDVAGVLLLSMSVPATRHPDPHPHHHHQLAAGAAAHEPGVATAPAGRRRRAKSEPQLSAAFAYDTEGHRTAPASTAAASSHAHPDPNSAHDAAGSTTTATTTDAAAAAAGELLAFALLQRLATTHLRDATRPTLEPVVQLLGLVPPLVAAADPALGRHLGALGLQPFFALSWFLTWWAHELHSLAPAARLFDFLLASHPLMPLYLGAVAMRSQRAALLACEEMPELHSALTNLQLVPGGADGGGGRRGGHGGGAGAGGAKAPQLPALEELLRQAEALWRAKPPHVLLAALMQPSRGPGAPGAPAVKGGGAGLRQRRGALPAAGDKAGRGRGGGAAAGEAEPGAGLVLSACVAHAARMEGVPAVWHVPPEPPLEWPGPELLGEVGGRSGLARLLGRAGTALAGRSRGALFSTALLAGVYVAAAVAIGYATFTRATEGGGMH